MDFSQKSLELHEINHGKLSVQSKIEVNNYEDLSLVYTPGVARQCELIRDNPDDIYKYTIKSNSVAVVTNGTAVLGLGDIGADAALPVMEGKCMLFKQFAGIDAFPICIDTKNVDEFVETVKRISTTFGGINLEDISAPSCFEIEKRLINELEIPVFHDDQHGTAITALAALINALRVVDKQISDCKIVIVGAGAAGVAITELLLRYGAKNILVCDSKGIISENREDLINDGYKKVLAKKTNMRNEEGGIADALIDADVFIGVSGAGLLTGEMIKTMAAKSIIFAMANPIPEIMPDDAKSAGAYIVGTGRSDFPNQINNLLAFPGIFRGMLDIRGRYVTKDIMIAVAEALASLVDEPTCDIIVPEIFNPRIAKVVAEAVKLNSK